MYNIKKVKKDTLFALAGRSLVIVQNQETRNRGWWIPAGKVNAPEEFQTTAIRETKEETGIDIKLLGILKIIYDNSVKVQDIDNFMILKIIFYANPINPEQVPKTNIDQHSEGAKWIKIDDYLELIKNPPFQRGDDLLVYHKYLSQGGQIFPLYLFEKDKLSQQKGDYYGFS